MSTPSPLRYREQGLGSTLCLLHGFPLDNRVYDAVLPYLPRHFRTVLVDLSGFGKSLPPTPMTIASMARQVHELLQQLGSLPVVLGGLSMGGYITLAFARQFPSDLRGMALIDTKSEADSTLAKQARNQMIQSLKAEGTKAVADAMFPKMLSPTTMKSRPQIGEQLRSIMESCDSSAVRYALEALRDREDYTDCLASMACPALVVVGGADVIAPPAIAKQMAQALPNAQLLELPDCGHIAPMEQPELLAEALSGLMKQVEP